jgi:hypothetical protein
MSTFYRLTVQRIERDPDYDAKAAIWQREHGGPRLYDYRERDTPPHPVRDMPVGDALAAELTADEFHTLRNGVLEVWNMR